MDSKFFGDFYWNCNEAVQQMFFLTMLKSMQNVNSIVCQQIMVIEFVHLNLRLSVEKTFILVLVGCSNKKKNLLFEEFDDV